MSEDSSNSTKMHLHILGSAAGGGFPQWNCGCPNCLALRRCSFIGKARTHAQLAISDDGFTWFLTGASPDLPAQIESCPDLHPRERRHSPIAGIILTSADLDHVLGLLLLREFQSFRTYATASVLRILREQNSMFRMLNRVAPQVAWSRISVGANFPVLTAQLKNSGLCCKALSLSGRYPTYADTTGFAPDEAVIGLFLQSSSGKRVAFLPTVPNLSDALMAEIAKVDLLLFDGTFWNDYELAWVRGGNETVRQMGHLPVEETLQLLSGLKVPRKLFIHINNTNPILNEAGPEYHAVRKAGWELAEDGCQLKL